MCACVCAPSVYHKKIRIDVYDRNIKIVSLNGWSWRKLAHVGSFKAHTGGTSLMTHSDLILQGGMYA